MTAPSSDDTEKLIMLASIRRKRALFGPVVGTLFETYDVDASGSLEMDEVRTMIQDCVRDENKALDEEEVVEFMKAIIGESQESSIFQDDDGLTISKKQFISYVLDMLVQGKQRLKEFGSQSLTHKKIYLFLKHLLDDQSRLEQAAFERNREAYEDHIEDLFDKYDKDGNGSIDCSELKGIITDAMKLGRHGANVEAVPGDDEIEVLMRSLDNDGSMTLDLDEFTAFVMESLSQSEDKRMKFAGRSSLHQKLYLFLDSIFSAHSDKQADAKQAAAARVIQRNWRSYKEGKRNARLMQVLQAARQYDFEDILAAAGESDQEEEEEGGEGEEEKAVKADTRENAAEPTFEPYATQEDASWLDAGTSAIPKEDGVTTGAESVAEQNFYSMDEDGMASHAAGGEMEAPAPAPMPTLDFEEEEQDDDGSFREVVVKEEEEEQVPAAPTAGPNAVKSADQSPDAQREAMNKNENLENFIWNYICCQLTKQLSQMSDLFDRLDSSGDGKLDRTELLSALGQLHIFLAPKESEIFFKKLDIGLRGSITFVQFHRTLHDAQHSTTIRLKDFVRAVRMLGMPLETSQIQKMYRRLDTNDNGHIYFDSLKQELHGLRDPILKKRLGMFSSSVAITLRKLDSTGICSVISFKERDLKLLQKMKPPEQEDIIRRLVQTLTKDRSKSGRLTLSRLLGTAKREDLGASDPVKRFLGDYVSAIFRNSGVRVSELFRSLDHSGDGFLTFEELKRGFDKKTDMDLTTAEVHILHDFLDADGDGDLSYKEVRGWLESAQEEREINFDQFGEAMRELGFGEMRDSHLVAIFDAVSNIEPGKGGNDPTELRMVRFDLMYDVLHDVDSNGLPLAAHLGAGMTMNSSGSGVVKAGQVSVGLMKKNLETEGGVPAWLMQLQWDPSSRFAQKGVTLSGAGLAYKSTPKALRKVLKDFSLPVRRELNRLDEAGLVRVTDLPKAAIRQLRDMNEEKALKTLKDLYDRLTKDRGRGHNAEAALNHIFKLDRKRQADLKRHRMNQAKAKGKKVYKKVAGSIDANTFARQYVMASLSRNIESAQQFLSAVAAESKRGGDWQSAIRKKEPRIYARLGLTKSQLSLLRWVLEGHSYEENKIMKILRKQRDIVVIDCNNFIHGLNLLGEPFSDSDAEKMYNLLGGDEKQGRISLSKLAARVEEDRMRRENKDSLAVLDANVDGMNWMDQLEAGAVPSWATESMPKIAVRQTESSGPPPGSLSKDVGAPLWKVAQEERRAHVLSGPLSKASPRTRKLANRYARQEQRGQGQSASTFGGALYPPRMAEKVDDFARASMRAGVKAELAERNMVRGQKVARRMKKKKNKKT